MGARQALAAVGILAIAGVFFWLARPSAAPDPAPAAPAAPIFDSTISDGTITIGYPAPEFGLAVRREQLPGSYIPACDDGFAYCVYLASGRFAGTNFESAGIGVRRRDDLAAAGTCLSAQPEGFANLEPDVATTTGYAAATFGGVGTAGAGHYATGDLYRLEVDGRCYELETRVGASQFQNHEPGSVREFTVDDNLALHAELRGIVDAVSLATGERVAFPRILGR